MESPNPLEVLASKDVRVELYSGEKLLAALSELVTHWSYTPAYINDAGEQVEPAVTVTHTMTAPAAKEFMELTNSSDLSINVVFVDKEGADACAHHFTPSDVTIVPDDLSLTRSHEVSSNLQFTIEAEAFFVPPDYEPEEDDDEDEDDEDDEDDELGDEPLDQDGDEDE